jgi:hypothetical protein
MRGAGSALEMRPRGSAPPTRGRAGEFPLDRMRFGHALSSFAACGGGFLLMHRRVALSFVRLRARLGSGELKVYLLIALGKVGQPRAKCRLELNEQGAIERMLEVGHGNCG